MVVASYLPAKCVVGAFCHFSDACVLSFLTCFIHINNCEAKRSKMCQEKKTAIRKKAQKLI